MTPTINQVSVAGRVQQLSAGAMQTIHDSLKSVYTAAEEQKERKKKRQLLLRLLNSNISFQGERIKGW